MHGLGLADNAKRAYREISKEELNAAAAGACVEKDRQPEIPRLMDSNLVTSQRLSEAVARLEQKLGPVLRPAPPAEDSAKSAFVNTLAGEALTRLETMNFLTFLAIEGLIERLEV
jgi:hypothetical protein